MIDCDIKQRKPEYIWSCVNNSTFIEQTQMNRYSCYLVQIV